jgi:hypothetical protein
MFYQIFKGTQQRALEKSVWAQCAVPLQIHSNIHSGIEEKVLPSVLALYVGVNMMWSSIMGLSTLLKSSGQCIPLDSKPV